MIILDGSGDVSGSGLPGDAVEWLLDRVQHIARLLPFRFLQYAHRHVDGFLLGAFLSYLCNIRRLTSVPNCDPVRDVLGESVGDLRNKKKVKVSE